MTTLAGLISGPAKVTFDGGKTWIDSPHVSFEPLDDPDGQIVDQVYSLVAGAGVAVPAEILAALYQDDDAHDTCSLTACLNPLHPGPCKGWKHSLFNTSPGAWHALEAARVEKANKNRIAKIEALKAQNKPIPHKLLAPIVAKPHPHAGKTAAKASGDAHQAGKDVSANAGVHVNEPGKVTLGMAVKKPAGPVQLGPKGKKPTVMSKGIAAVIAQEKVTPQYKLDKAATITPEQWKALDSDDKALIKGELGKIQQEGFGPQQKKATELLGKFAEHDNDAVAKHQAINAQHQADTAAEAMKVPIKLPEPEAPKAEATKLGDTGASVKVKTTDVQVGDLVKGNSEAFNNGVHKVAKISETKSEGLKNGHAQINLHDESGKVFFTGTKVSKATVIKTAPETPKLTLTEPKTVKEAKADGTLAKAAEVAANAAHQAKASAEAKAAAAKKAEAEAPKPQPKHVTEAIAMAKGTAPGASWSKNHLAAYSKLTPEEYQALPMDVRQKIVAELGKGKTKFLDPKKIKAAQDLIDKLTGAKAEKPKIKNKAETHVDFAKDLRSHSITKTQAKEAVAATSPTGHFLAAKEVAGLTDEDNPDGAHIIKAAGATADTQIDHMTALYTPEITKQPDVKAAITKAKVAAFDLAKLHEVHNAKAKAFAKINTKLSTDGGKLAPIEKASLEAYQKHLLEGTGQTHLDDVKAAQKADAAAKTELTHVLHAALKKANTPKPEDMTGAQLEDATYDLLGEKGDTPSMHLTLADTKTAKVIGSDLANQQMAKYNGIDTGDPKVQAKYGALAHAFTQQQMLKTQKAKLDQHVDSLKNTTFDKNGKALTPDDKKILALHAAKVQENNAYIEKGLADQEQKIADAKAQFHAAAGDAPAAPAAGELNAYDTEAVRSAYSDAWAKAATKAVVYGIKGYGTKTKMSEHPDYAAFKQDLGDLRQRAGQLAIAHAKVKAAHDAVPTHPDTGALDKTSPEYQVLTKVLDERGQIESSFSQLHKQAQAKLDKIRESVGLKKRALPKIDSPAVKTAAAETTFYKTVVYGGPNYGESAAAKNYLLTKVGPGIAVAHKTSSDKAEEKYGKQAEQAKKVAESMPAPKVHAKPPAEEKGKAPNPETAAKLGYHYTPQVATVPHGQGWAAGAAYAATPEALADLQSHLGKPDTKFGIEAQKQFKWSINNMEGKGATPAGKKALYAYSGSAYGAVNAKLNGLPPGAKSPGGQISSIDAAFAAAPPLEGDVVLYRGFSDPNSVFKSGKWNDVNVAGTEWTQRSYSSTSGALSTARSFAGHGGVVMRVIIPKEMQVKGINAKGGQHPGENEVILQRGIRYRVVADYGKGKSGDDRRYIDVMVVPSPYDKPE